MLIYSRVPNTNASSAASSVNGKPSRVTNGSTNGIHSSISQDSVAIETVPPPRALEVVAALNAAHDEACEKYTERFINRCSA